ncbi:MAG: hypothetical protein RJA81_1432 [Planctomycetota bacterium]
MKIALITETYPPQINGVSRTLEHLTQYLCHHGHRMLVVAPDYQEPEKADKLTEIHCPQRLRLRSTPLPFYKEVVIPLPPYTRMRKAIQVFQPDLVHIATEGPLGLTALRFCQRQRIPVVSSFHTNFDAYASHYHMSMISPLVLRYLRWFHNQTLATFVPSQTVIRELQTQGFQGLRLWSRGVDTKLFHPHRAGSSALRRQLGIPEQAFVAGHCGRLASEKNIEFLGKALAGFLAENAEAHVLIVGDGPGRLSLDQQIRKRIHDCTRLHFTGYLCGEALANAYSAMNAFAFASRTETFGNVILEAAASGLPVVAIAEGGPRDVIQNGRTGQLIAPKSSPEAMTEVLLDWSLDQNRKEYLAKEARKYAEEQTWDRIMAGLLEDYQKVLSMTKN